MNLTESMEWVANVYSMADALAVKYAKLSVRLWCAVFVLAAFSGIALPLRELEIEKRGSHVTLGAYCAFIFVAFLLMVWEWHGGLRPWECGVGLRKCHEDYRALAEALRVQFFWMAAGLPDMAAEQYLPKQSGEMAWIRDAISECALYRPAKVEHLPLRFRLAHEWVTGQAKYFSKTLRHHKKNKMKFEIFAWAASAVGIATPLFAFSKSFEGSHVIAAFAAIALWFAALTWLYIERRGFAQEGRQYARMYKLFHDADRALEYLEKKTDYLGSEQTIRELGREALEENGDWLSMHRERKLRVDVLTG